MEFKVGDICDLMGVKGTIIATDLENQDEYVWFKSKCGDVCTRLYKDGKQESWHKEPSLKLIERPKSRKKIKMCAFVWKDSAVSYQSASDVQEGSTDYKNRLVNNKFFRVESKDYEIEVEE